MGKKAGGDTEAWVLPGRQVATEAGPCTVYPLGVIHIRQFKQRLSAALQFALGKVGRKGATEEELGNDLVAVLVPHLVDELLDLLEDCVRFERDGVRVAALPHWDLPVIAEAWLRESFDEERKRRPWVQAVREAVSRMAGRMPPSLEKLFKRWQPVDTPSPTSSDPSSPGSHTEDGASLS